MKRSRRDGLNLPVIPHAGEAETEDCESRVILNYIATTYLKKEKKRIIIALKGWKYR